jgi:hypothetical protein
MRNFWVESFIDGRKTLLASGPRRKDGEMHTVIKVKEEGNSVEAVSIVCFPTEQGNRIVVRDETNGERIYDRVFTP